MSGPSPIDRLREALTPRYEVHEELGAGGMAIVYLATDSRHDRQVAVKVLRPELAASVGADRFLNEIKIAARLQHPHILPLFDSGEAGSGRGMSSQFLYYVMPYVEGESLREWVRRETQLPIDEALNVAREVADALAYAHSRGIVHRDIKPDNILLVHGHAAVADFGIARALSAAGGDKLTETGLALGTPAYMSPEQASGEGVDGRADIYALGCVLYEMLAGDPPFRGPTAQATLARHAVDPVPSLRTVRDMVSRTVEQAIVRALAKVPADRYPTATAFSEALTEPPSEPPAGPAPSGKAPPNSIAVIPFRDMSQQRDQEYFCDGMAEELIDALSRVDGVTVASRTSAFALKGGQQDVRQIGSQLNVATILEGSVRTAGDRLRIAVSLNNVADGYQLWSERYDRDMADVFAIQDEIAQTVVETLTPRLTTDPGARVGRVGEPKPAPLVKRGTTNVDAYNLYLKGRHFWNRRFEGTLQKAIECFTQALEHDPVFAPAYAGLADSFLAFGTFDFLPPKDAFPRALAAASKALEIDDGLSEAHSSFGLATMYYERDWERAGKSMERALEIKPEYPSGHQFYSIWLCARGRFDEAIVEAERARDLDQLSPMISAMVAWIHYFAGRHDEAILSCRTTVEMFPEFGVGHGILGQAYLEVGRFDEGIAELEQSAKKFPPAVGALGYAYGVAGREAEGRKIAEEMITRSQSEWVSPYGIAIAYTGLDDRPNALEWLERSEDERSMFMALAGVNPMFERLRDEPRFVALLGKLGLR